MKRHCLAILLLISAPVFAFSENDFARAMQTAKAKNRNIVFYTWSPHMVLSQRGLEELKFAPFPSNTDLIVLLDPDCDPKLAKQIIERNGWPETYGRQVKSETLLKKGVRIHYPTYIFSRSGGQLAPIVPGYKTTAQLERLAKRYLE